MRSIEDRGPRAGGGALPGDVRREITDGATAGAGRPAGHMAAHDQPSHPSHEPPSNTHYAAIVHQLYVVALSLSLSLSLLHMCRAGRPKEDLGDLQAIIFL